MHRNPSLLPSRLLVFANNLWNSSVRCFSTPTPTLPPTIRLLLHEKTWLLLLICSRSDIPGG